MQRHIPAIGLPHLLTILNIAYSKEVATAWLKGDQHPLTEVPAKFHTLCALGDWIMATDEIVTGLNLIVNDLLALESNADPVEGRIRYFLLLRSFFSEFRRARLIYDKFIDEARRLGKFDRKQAKDAKERYKSHYSEVLTVRDLLVHRDLAPRPPQKELLVAASFLEGKRLRGTAVRDDEDRARQALKAAAEDVVPLFIRWSTEVVEDCRKFASGLLALESRGRLEEFVEELTMKMQSDGIGVAAPQEQAEREP